MPTKWYPKINEKNSENYLWISVHPRKLSYTSPIDDFNMRSKIVAQEDSSLVKFMFLAPDQLQDNITHEWEPLENIMSKTANMAGQARQSVSLGREVHKVNTALVYSDSNRREVSFTVNLSTYENPYEEVVEPVKLLELYSSPSLYGESIWETKVTVPNIFKVDTKIGGRTVNLINMRHAVLTAVQPTFKAPYIHGHPASCELTLTFKDMEPLSKDSFKVTVNGRPPAGIR